MPTATWCTALRSTRRGVALRLATVTCAGLLGVFVVTNGVCYAATGETWVEKATVCTNSEPAEAGVQMVLESPDGRVVLAPEGVEPIDVTDQLKANGVAAGTYDKDGATYAYQVGGEPGNWHAYVQLEGDSAECTPSAAAEVR